MVSPTISPVVASLPRAAPDTECAAFWTHKQRQGCSLHEISYRACFKAELPHYFIERYSKPKDWVYDPFAGRGTTALEAALMGRIPFSNDLNPLSRILCEPRLCLPVLEELSARIDLALTHSRKNDENIDLSMFFHPETFHELCSVHTYLQSHPADELYNQWLRMLVTNRLTGHSPGFLSVYTLPPNQATSAKQQTRLNKKRQQTPPYRNLKQIILKKAKSLLRRVTEEQKANLLAVAKHGKFFTSPAHDTVELANNSIDLIVTSPPFLNVINYAKDNWLRGWFNDICMEELPLTMSKNLTSWNDYMAKVFVELLRICKPGGYLAFEVGEIRRATLALDEQSSITAQKSGWDHEKTFINQQQFTKTANLWGIKNNHHGTNTNRIVLLKKPH